MQLIVRRAESIGAFFLLVCQLELCYNEGARAGRTAACIRLEKSPLLCGLGGFSLCLGRRCARDVLDALKYLLGLEALRRQPVRETVQLFCAHLFHSFLPPAVYSARLPGL